MMIEALLDIDNKLSSILGAQDVLSLEPEQLTIFNTLNAQEQGSLNQAF